MSDFGAASTSGQNDQKTPTIKSTVELTTTNSYYDLLQRDLKALKRKNAQLKKEIEIMEKSSNSITTQLKKIKDGNSMLTEEFNVKLLTDNDYHCPVCYEIFIQPVLLKCTHMFCEWCINNCSKEHNYCPLCRGPIAQIRPCLNMKSFIKKRIQLLPATIRSERKILEEDRKKTRSDSKELEDYFLNHLLPLYGNLLLNLLRNN